MKPLKGNVHLNRCKVQKKLQLFLEAANNHHPVFITENALNVGLTNTVRTS